jgi:cytochrome b pre-mRNA-processing protein 3
VRSILTHLFGSNERRQRTDRLLAAITAEARRPVYFEVLGVPDTLDGRFDLMSLFGALVFRSLAKKGRDGITLAQDTTDLMFSAFDDAIRSLGVGDSGIPRRVKTMGKAYIGRAKAYDEAITVGDLPALEQAIARNVYRGEAPEGVAAALAAQAMAEAAILMALPLERFQAGELGQRPVPGEEAAA